MVQAYTDLPLSDSAPIAAPARATRMRAELEALPATGLLAQRGEIDVVLAPGRAIPELLHEIGRLREITFRLVGEGTHKALDLDEFDPDYDHLIAWQRERGAVLGAYRWRETWGGAAFLDPQKLYSHTLFDYDTVWLRGLGPALELGRAFIVPEHQRSSSVLPLLWKGIGAWLCANPDVRTLFGPVSIPASYPDPVRRRMIAGLQAAFGDVALARGVRARTPFEAGACAPELGDTGAQEALDALSGEVARLDPERRGLPVLVREYAKLGGRFVGFNLDCAFADAVDGLVVVRLDHTPRRSLQFYMGRSGAEAFARHRCVWSRTAR